MSRNNKPTEALPRITLEDPSVVTIRKDNNAEGAEDVFAGNTKLLPSQLKILVPVGKEIRIVAPVKYALVSVSRPTVYIWCPHTIDPSNEIQLIAKIIDWLPNTIFWETQR